MATEQQIQAVVDAIVTAFEGDAAAFQAFLTRSKLETDYRAIESDIRKAQEAEDVQNTAFRDALAALVDQLEAKQAEIDAL